MVTLLLQRLNEEEDNFDNVAEWDTESGEDPPEEFTRIYPADEWHDRDPEWFMARIDGPYTVLTETDG